MIRCYFIHVDSATKAKTDFVYKSWYINAGYTIRKGFFTKHIFSASYSYIKVADSVITTPYNPNYFKDPVTSKGFIDLIYTLQYANVNNGSYPLTGKTCVCFNTKKRPWHLPVALICCNWKPGIINILIWAKDGSAVFS